MHSSLTEKFNKYYKQLESEALLEDIIIESNIATVLPFNQKALDNLRILMVNPINNEEAKEKLGTIYNDSELYSLLENPSDDVRPLIRKALLKLVYDYHNREKDYPEKCDDKILLLLRNLGQRSDENR